MGHPFDDLRDANAATLAILRTAMREQPRPFPIVVNTGGPDILAEIEDQTPPNAAIARIGCVWVRFSPQATAWMLPNDCRPRVDADNTINARGLTFAAWQQQVWRAALTLALGTKLPTPEELRAMRRQWSRCEDPEQLARSYVAPNIRHLSESRPLRTRARLGHHRSEQETP